MKPSSNQLTYRAVSRGDPADRSGIPCRYAAIVALIAVASTGGACSFDPGHRWRDEPKEPLPIHCSPGARTCSGNTLLACTEHGEGPSWEIAEDCAPGTCALSLLACAACDPGSRRCVGASVELCLPDGSGYQSEQECDADQGLACRGGACQHLCSSAASRRSNVGCEYWAADLDNAVIDESLNAAAQQFAVVVSNPELDVPATVVIEQDDSAPGTEGAPVEIARARVPPRSLRVFRLGPREVDGSPPGEFNTGTHSALTRAAFRVRSSIPVVAYQFNPLENVNVFSNDASLLKPVEALTFNPGTMHPAYVVLGWPQTIASTDDPATNFSAARPIDLRAFVTIVGTRKNTRVRITPSDRVLGGMGIPETQAGESMDLELGPFDVANLESDGFNADFTGSLIEADQPIVVFSGGEASDAPFFASLAERRCCADHLEEQLDPIRTAGKKFVAPISPNRTAAITLAGGDIGHVDAPEYFRIIAATEQGATVATTFDGDRTFVLPSRGSFIDITAARDFMIESDAPIMLSSVSPSQAASGVPTGYPGGDPSLLVIPPIEQFRDTYVFLTPDRYSFDFVRLLVPVGAEVRLDDRPIESLGCEVIPLPGVGGGPVEFVVYRCQLSFPVVDPSPDAVDLVRPGQQNDGVHEIIASEPIGVLVDGFDRNVSYAYAAGTELTELVLR
jgi:hypothetical protein